MREAVFLPVLSTKPQPSSLTRQEGRMDPNSYVMTRQRYSTDQWVSRKMVDGRGTVGNCFLLSKTSWGWPDGRTAICKASAQRPMKLMFFFLLGISESHSEFCSPPTPFLASICHTHMRARNGCLQIVPSALQKDPECDDGNHDGDEESSHSTTLYWESPCARLWPCAMQLFIFMYIILPKTQVHNWGKEHSILIYFHQVLGSKGVKSGLDLSIKTLFTRHRVWAMSFRTI